MNSDAPAPNQIDQAAGQFSQTIGVLAPGQVDTLAPAFTPANFQPLVLDIEEKDAFGAEYPPTHPESTAQGMLNVLEPDAPEVGKAIHRVG